MYCGHLNLQCCVKYVHELRNQTSSPPNLRIRSPQVQSSFAWLAWYCAAEICYSDIEYTKDVEALYCFINILTTSNVKTQNDKQKYAIIMVL